MFDCAKYVPEGLFDAITETRVRSPRTISTEAAARRRRPELAPDGRLCVLACDHPARLVTHALGDPVAMADRRDYLGRILRVLSHNEIDGVMATPDIIDDLLIVGALQRKATGRSFLDGKVLMGCMNRGGLSGAVFEMDDRMTGYDAESIRDSGLDCAKLMFRLCIDNPDSLATIEYCSQALSQLVRLGIPAFLEPLPVERVDSGYRVSKNAHDLMRVIGVASALGVSSALTWLKVPIVPDFARVCRATTLPMLLLGGEPSGDPARLMLEFRQALDAGTNVRGALIGRNVLYPGSADPLGAAVAVSRMVHLGIGAEEAASTVDSVGLYGLNTFDFVADARP